METLSDKIEFRKGACSTHEEVINLKDVKDFMKKIKSDFLFGYREKGLTWAKRDWILGIIDKQAGKKLI